MCRLIRKLSTALFATLLGITLLPMDSIGQPVRGQPGDLWADKILGQVDFGEITINQADNKSLFNAYSMVVDNVHNRMYVYDSGNSRVLGVSNLATLTSGQGADMVLGQPDFNHAACNGDSNIQNYPSLTLANASCLCGEVQGQPSPAEGGSVGNMAVDGQGNLYVPDYYNNRVLRYDWPITTGQAASHVWGQADFTGIRFNQGGSPTASSLGFYPDYHMWQYVAGVAVDGWGNLWVADQTNNRVLRFPNLSGTLGGVPSSTPDVVLGQTDFNSNVAGTSLTRMQMTSAVRVDGTGRVFVGDIPNLGAGRILIFNPTGYSGTGVPTYTNGMAAFRTITQDLSTVKGLEWDPSGDLWVTDANQVLLFHFTFTPAFSVVIKKVLLKDQPQAAASASCGTAATGDNPVYFTDNAGVAVASWSLCDIRGSVGVDASGNVFVASNLFQDIWRFPAPIPTPVTGKAHSADIQVFKPSQFGMRNTMGSRGLNNPQGVVAASGQVVVADNNRIMFWNNPSGPIGLINGQNVDGFTGTANPFLALNGNRYGRIREDHASPQQHLWAIRNWDQAGQIEVYNLPLANNAPLAYPRLSSPLPVLGGGTLSWSRMDGMTPDSNGTHVWLADPLGNRVFRVRNPLTAPVVDIILGQTSASATLCNQGGTTAGYCVPCSKPPTAYTLFQPGAVSMDHLGNLYVSDGALECWGNYRILRWNASQFPDTPTSCRYAIPATAVYGMNGSFTSASCVDSANGVCGPLEPGFNASDTAMVAGMNPYEGSLFPVVLQNPLTSDNPVAHLGDLGSLPYATTFDPDDNLYVLDSNRNRVMIYYAPFPSPTPTLTYTLTPTLSPSPTGTWYSPTIPPTPTYTPSPTPTVACCQSDLVYAGEDRSHDLRLDSHYLYVGDAGNGRVSIFDKNVGTAPVAVINNTNHPGLDFVYPSGVMLDGQGHLFVADFGRGKVYQFDNVAGYPLRTTFTGTGGAPAVSDVMMTPHTVWSNSAGTTLAVANSESHEIRIFNLQGGLYIPILKLTMPAYPGFYPLGMTGDDSGNLYVVDSTDKLLLHFSGPNFSVVDQVQDLSSVMTNPRYWVRDSAGNHYVTDNGGKFTVFDPGWNSLYSCTGGNGLAFNQPQGIAVDLDGHIYVSDQYQERVLRYLACYKTLGTPTWTTTPTIPTFTFSPTATPSPSATVSGTPTSTNSSTQTSTQTSTSSFTPTPSATPTSTSSYTSTSTLSSTPTSSPTRSATPTWSPTIENTFTVTPTPGLLERPVLCQPNPIRGDGPVRVWWSSMNHANKVRIALVTQAFRLVRRIEAGSRPPGLNFLDLTLRDQWGRPLANGIYFVLVESDDHREIGKLLVLR